MIDQTSIHLLNLIPGDFKKVGGTGGGEFHGPCPMCGGKDRFIIQPNAENGGRWSCRQCTPEWGDAISFLMAYEGIEFLAAAERLNLILADRTQKPTAKPQPPVFAADLREDYLCFDPAWQTCAEAYVMDCHLRLVATFHSSTAGKYLEGRGIDRRTAQGAFLGVNPSDYRSEWGAASVWLPRGIVIPWRIQNQLWNVRLRRPNADLKTKEDAKYIGPKGTANGMYRIDDLMPEDTVVMTEGEFDALLLRRFLLNDCRFDTTVVSIGSNTGAHLLRWASRLSIAKRIYLAFDNDPAGDSASLWWSQALGRKAVRIRPSQKDITEMYQHGELIPFMKEIQ